MSKNNGKKIAIGAIAAGAAGFVAGILSAPKSGKDTRKDIKTAANKALTEGEHQLKNLHSELATLVDKAESQAKEIKGKATAEMNKSLQAAKKAKDKSRELLTALHDGDADDKELKATIKQAQSALKHLTNFYKK